MAQKVYSIDVKIYGTAYIKADTEEEALKIAKAMKNDALELDEQDGEVSISGAQLDSEDLPDVSLSPAMTVYGPDEGIEPELCYDPDEDEEEEAAE